MISRRDLIQTALATAAIMGTSGWSRALAQQKLTEQSLEVASASIISAILSGILAVLMTCTTALSGESCRTVHLTAARLLLKTICPAFRTLRPWANCFAKPDRASP